MSASVSNMHHRGGVEEEGGVVWWEIRLGDSPGSKSTGINPKLSKSTKNGKKNETGETSVESLFWCWLTVGPWLSLLVALKLKICGGGWNRKQMWWPQKLKVKTVSTFTFVSPQPELADPTNTYHLQHPEALCPHLCTPSCQPCLWWHWSLQKTDDARCWILQIHFHTHLLAFHRDLHGGDLLQAQLHHWAHLTIHRDPLKAQSPLLYSPNPQDLWVLLVLQNRQVHQGLPILQVLLIPLSPLVQQFPPDLQFLPVQDYRVPQFQVHLLYTLRILSGSGPKCIVGVEGLWSGRE